MLPMERSIDGIEGLFGNLKVAEERVQSRGQERKRSTREHLASLQTSIRTLRQPANAMASKAQSVRSLAIGANSLSIAEACSLHGEIKKLEEVTQSLQATLDALNEAAEHSVFISLRSYGGQSGVVGKILSHFEKQIKAVIRDVLDHTSDNAVLWKVAEECYDQATKPFGKLDAENYFAPLEEACLGWPYDSDFESEQYYEHENRLDLDEDYAATFREREDRRFDTHMKDRQRWPNFWVSVLNNAPAGPTLFYPPAALQIPESHLDAVPRYLFRTFDKVSSGRNNDSVVASTASILGSHESSRSDLLTLDRHIATQLLYQHLNKDLFGGEGSDNLMSWTSSLLFAIQYAIWRAGRRGCLLSDVKICAVDTRKFPEGQFVQDLWLLRSYFATAKQIGGKVGSFFQFRLEREDYYNGEYLSQGELNHAGRSCVMPLLDLLDAGLRQLYPEFEEPRGYHEWTNRVLELRQNWSTEQLTTNQEIELAFEVARNCFAQFNSSEIATVLLTFKNRKHPRLEVMGHFNKQPPNWADKPAEVRRYWIATEILNTSGGYSKAPINLLLLQNPNTLRQIFS